MRTFQLGKKKKIMISQSHSTVKFQLVEEVGDKKIRKRRRAWKQELGVQL